RAAASPGELDDEDYPHCERSPTGVRVESAWVESAFRCDVHFACAAVVAPIDAFADADHANCFAGSCFLPAEARWSWWPTFFYLEISNHEAERRNPNSRTLLRGIDAMRLSDDQAGYCRGLPPGPVRANPARKRIG